jgi:hypothetical protein
MVAMHLQMQGRLSANDATVNHRANTVYLLF